MNKISLLRSGYGLKCCISVSAVTLALIAFLGSISWAEVRLVYGCERQIKGPDLAAFIENLVERRSQPSRIHLIERVLEGLEKNDLGALERMAETTVERLEMRALRGFLGSTPDRSGLRIRLTSILESLRSAEVGRKRVQGATLPHSRPVRFVRVSGGRFLAPARDQVPEDGSAVDDFQPLMADYELSYDIEVMDVPVTQSMWVAVMGQNVRVNRGRYPGDLTEVTVHGKQMLMAADFPVMGATMASVAEFANRFSELHGLKPAYDLGSRGNGSADDGTLTGNQVRHTNQRLEELEGFRVPTDVEWLRLVSDLSRELNSLDVNSQVARLNEVGWFYPQSDYRLSAVGSKHAILVDGQKIYDLIGLVDELVVDLNNIERSSGDLYMRFRARGLNFGEEISAPHAFVMKMRPGMYQRPDVATIGQQSVSEIAPDEFIERFPRAGFRLVRTLPREERSRSPQKDEN